MFIEFLEWDSFGVCLCVRVAGGDKQDLPPSGGVVPARYWAYCARKPLASEPFSPLNVDQTGGMPFPRVTQNTHPRIQEPLLHAAKTFPNLAFATPLTILHKAYEYSKAPVTNKLDQVTGLPKNPSATPHFLHPSH